MYQKADVRQLSPLKIKDLYFLRFS